MASIGVCSNDVHPGASYTNNIINATAKHHKKGVPCVLRANERTVFGAAAGSEVRIFLSLHRRLVLSFFFCACSFACLMLPFVWFVVVFGLVVRGMRAVVVSCEYEMNKETGTKKSCVVMWVVVDGEGFTRRRQCDKSRLQLVQQVQFHNSSVGYMLREWVLEG